MKKLKIYGILFLLFLPLLSFSQQVKNVRFKQHGKQIHIYYDLQGNGTYNVNIFCSTDNSHTWGQALQKVTGAIGKNQKAGNNKEIIWDVLAEREKLEGNIKFKIEARKPINIEMVFVKGGTFQMGSNDGDKDEKPVHTVTVGDFYLGKYEITQKQWRNVMGSNPSYFNGCDNCPVENVSWNDIQEFLRKFNQKTGQHYRLPTEAEWEYAARGGSLSPAGGGAGGGHKYAGSNNIDEVAWYWKNSGDVRLNGDWKWDKIKNNNCKTHPVGKKQPNELGIYDMSGNVWEWCSDWYGKNYYSSSPRNNPQGPSSGSYRVFRGGSWIIYARFCRVSYRIISYPDPRSNYLGFRLVLVP